MRKIVNTLLILILFACGIHYLYEKGYFDKAIQRINNYFETEVVETKDIPEPRTHKVGQCVKPRWSSYARVILHRGNTQYLVSSIDVHRKGFLLNPPGYEDINNVNGWVLIDCPDKNKVFVSDTFNKEVEFMKKNIQ